MRKIDEAILAMAFIYIGFVVLAILTFLIGRGKSHAVQLFLWGIALLIPIGLLMLFTNIYSYNYYFLIEHPHGFKLLRRIFPLLGGIGFILIVFSLFTNVGELIDNVMKRFLKKDD